MMVAIASIGGRAIIMDNFTGHRLNVGLLYTSVTYALGPIIAPFIGGILQFYFGWKANFLAYALFSTALFLIFIIYINESLHERKNFLLKNVLYNYSQVIRHTTFMSGVFVIALSQIESMVYPTVGAFLVENILHHSPIVYGNTALLIGCGYLMGTLTNRFFIQRWHLQHLTTFGFILLIISLIIQYIFVFVSKLSLFTIILPIILIGFGNGFIFSNTLGRCLRLFPNNVGIAIGLLSSLIMGISAIGVFIISHIAVNNLISLASIFSVVIAIQILVFSTIFSSGMKSVPF